MIEKFDTDIAVNCHYPVAYFVNIMDEFALCSTQTKCQDGALIKSRNPSSHRRHHPGDDAREICQQVYRTLHSWERVRSTMAWLPSPGGSIFVVLEIGNEVLCQAIQGCHIGRAEG